MHMRSGSVGIQLAIVPQGENHIINYYKDGASMPMQLQGTIIVMPSQAERYTLT